MQKLRQQGRAQPGAGAAGKRKRAKDGAVALPAGDGGGGGGGGGAGCEDGDVDGKEEASGLGVDTNAVGATPGKSLPDLARHIILHILDPRLFSQWHHMTWRALSAWP